MRRALLFTLAFVLPVAHAQLGTNTSAAQAPQISVQPVQTGRVGMTLSQAAWRVDAGGKPAQRVSEGEIRIACVDAGTFKPSRIPTDLLAALAASE